MEIGIGLLGLVIVIEGARRSLGLALPLLSLAFLLYAAFGASFPAWLFPHRGYSVSRIVAQTFLHSQGIFGVALSVMFTYVFLFVIFGAFLEATGATASCIFIPAPGVKDAVVEAAEGGIEFIVAITEGVPAHDEAWFYNWLEREHPNVQLLGPNCPGIISPGKCNIGITAGHIAKPGGPVGIVSRSGTLTYQALYELQQKDIGVTTCVGIGGDPVPGTSFIDCLAAFEADPETKAIMMIGEIGGSAEEEAAEFIKNNVSKPVSSYVAGVTAPPGKKMGHAGAIVSGGKGTAEAKMDALRDAGVAVGQNPTEAGELMAEIVAGL